MPVVPSGQQHRATGDQGVTPGTLAKGEGLDNGVRTLMVISQNFELFLFLPLLMVIWEGSNTGNSTEIFGKGDT